MRQYEFYEDDEPIHGLAMTVEAFEELIENAGPYRYEMINGIVYNMAPPSPEHSMISFNLTKIFKEQLGTGTPCQALQDQWVAVPGDKASAEPDVVVTCNIADWSKKYRKAKKHRIESPLIAVEILSPSTKKFDRGEKFARYISIPTLEVYMLVDQDKVQVEVYRKEHGWEQEIFTAGQIIQLDQMDLEVSVDEIYEGVFVE